MALLGWILFFMLLSALILAVAYLCYRIAFYNDLKDDDIYAIPPGEQYQIQAEYLHFLVAEMDSHAFEWVYITSQDGLRLAGRYYHLKDGAPLHIQFHGYRGNAIRDFCGGNKLARDMGHNTLVVDQRAHGRSQGRIISFGIKERYDCLEWTKYASDRFGKDTPIFLSGVSMGGATVLMASQLDLPENVAGVIADCPYSSPRAIIQKVCRDINFPPKFAYPFLALGALVFGHFCLWAASARKAVRYAKVPVLIIHGEDDKFVPCDMSREIWNACHEHVTLQTIPGAGHGISYAVDTPLYEQAVKRFAQQCLHSEGTC